MKKAKQTVKKPLIHHVKKALVPHKANQYRPHILRRHGLAVILLVVVALQVGYNATLGMSVLGRVNQITQTELLETTNEQRQNKGLPSLSANAELSQAAASKGKDMFTKQYWAHDAPDGTLPWKWIADTGYDYDYAGENLARNFTTNSGVMTAWMNSAEHRDNILSPHYTDVGFAIVDGELDGKPTTLVVALYASPSIGSVKGVVATKSVSEMPATTESIGLVSRLGIAVQSLTPAAIGAMVILLVVAGLAVVAHAYRNKLPKQLRTSWYRHHGAYKAIGLLSITVFIVALYSGGQI